MEIGIDHKKVTDIMTIYVYLSQSDSNKDFIEASKTLFNT